MKCLIRILFICFLFVGSSLAQKPTPTPASDEADTVKISTSLVQVDAVVTDKSGTPVKNLQADDFQLFQDGKPQKITNFSFVDTSSSKRTLTGAGDTSPNTGAIGNGTANQARTPGRVITFIVDDGNCAVTQIGMRASREALEKFINQQMQPSDLVAIYQTRNGSSMLQQFTSDKTRLLAVARKIRWYPMLGACGSGDIFENARSDNTMSTTGKGAGTFGSDDDKKRRESDEDRQRDRMTVGTLGVIRYVIRGLARVGGRKVVFLLSDGISVRARDGQPLETRNVLRDITELANRASVVLNTIDARGLFDPGMIQAGDDVQSRSDAMAADKIGAQRYADVANSQDGLSFLAAETGGQFYRNQNYLDVPIGRALAQEKGYYLLGYEPTDETFKGKKFHTIEIKLTKPDLKVSSRSGFAGKTDPDTAAIKKTADSELYEAILAPLPLPALNVQMTAYFDTTPAQGNFIRTLVHLNPDEITLTDESGGGRKAVFDVVAVTLDEKNSVVDEFNHTHTIHIPAAGLAELKQFGLVYSVDVPVKKTGAYNFRIAMRDAQSRHLGSAAQVIDVPDVKKGKLFMSSLLVSGVDAKGNFEVPKGAAADNAFSLTTTGSIPSIRRFRSGDYVAYFYTLYNARPDTQTRKPKVTVQVNLYREGVRQTEGKIEAVPVEKQPDLSRINDFGYLRLNPAMPAGEYELQVIVTDTVSGQAVSGWIGFDVTR
jgi:VWFA-related protein